MKEAPNLGGMMLIPSDESPFDACDRENRDTAFDEMKKLPRQILHFLLNEDGPTAVEYAVMLALIIMVCVATVAQLGLRTADAFIPVRNILATGS